MKATGKLVPSFLVRGASHAIDFYRRALGATLRARYPHGAERRVSHGPRTTPRSKQAASLEHLPSIGQAESDPLCPPIAKERQSRCGGVHLVIGPVGAGKSTFARRLAGERAAVRFALDDWMATLFAKDRPAQGAIAWYVERSGRCVEQIWKLARSIVDVGTSVVLEIGLLKRHQREEFYDRVGEAGFELTVYVLEAARTVRRQRVLQRNQSKGPTFSMQVPPDVFELASDLWEPPCVAECDGRDVRFFRTDTR